MRGRARPAAGPGWAERRVAAPIRWLVAAVLVLSFVAVLLVEAYVNAKFASDTRHAVGGATSVPRSVLDGGPIIDTRDRTPRSYDLPTRTIVLTFDDGPDPRWTPEIMRVLRRHDVNATFFVVGTQVARYPKLARTLVSDGNELGIHTFTHPRMATLPTWRQELEYSQTQMAIVGATGTKASLLRLPYSSGAGSIDDATWRLIQRAGGLGYLTVMTTADSRDWARPGIDMIVNAATPAADASSIVLLHDAGGDRSQTVAALDRYIPLMQSRGYRFTTASQALALTLSGDSADPAARPDPAVAAMVAGNQAVEADDRRRGLALMTAVRVADVVLWLLGVLFLLVGALALIRTALLFILAGRHARRRRSPTFRWGPPYAGPVSIIVPAYNEKEGIAAAVRSLANGDHPGGIEVIVVDDGSTDGTAGIVEAMGLPNVRLVRVPNGGKPMALNIGVAWARHEIIVMVDGDTIFEPDAVRRLVQPFADPGVGAVAGNVKVGNRRSLVARWQHIEYVIGFNLDRRLYDVMRCMPTIPGAIGGFRRQALRDVGGMSDDTLAEDTDITMALHRAGWRVVYEERARAWTEAPGTIGQLWKQRHRWSYGTMQAMWKHRRSIIERGPSGRFGRFGLPFVALFGVALPLLAPLIDILALYGLFFFDTTETALAWLAMLGLQFLTAAVAFRLDRERLGALWVLPLQQFMYRQLMYLVLIQSVVTALTGVRLRWHKLRRTGELSGVGPDAVGTGAFPLVPAPSGGPPVTIPLDGPQRASESRGRSPGARGVARVVDAGPAAREGVREAATNVR